MFRKALTWLVIGYVVYFVINEPTHAGELVRSGVSAIGTAGDHLMTFFDSLSSSS